MAATRLIFDWSDDISVLHGMVSAVVLSTQYPESKLFGVKFEERLYSVQKGAKSWRVRAHMVEASS